MNDSVTNDLLLEHMKAFRTEMKEFRGETKHELSQIRDMMAAMRDHIGTQQLDITTLHHRIDYLFTQLEIVKSALPELPAAH